jgi:hypothetical protein
MAAVCTPVLNIVDAIWVSQGSITGYPASSADDRPLEKSLQVAISGSRPLAWWVEKDADWLTVTPGSGWGNGEVNVGVNAIGLPPGQHTGHLMIRCQDAANSPQMVTVALKVLESRRRSGGQARLKIG